jgi:hypothetical protein
VSDIRDNLVAVRAVEEPPVLRNLAKLVRCICLARCASPLSGKNRCLVITVVRHTNVVFIEDPRIALRVDEDRFMLSGEEVLRLTPSGVDPHNLVQKAMRSHDAVQQELHVMPDAPVKVYPEGAGL